MKNNTKKQTILINLVPFFIILVSFLCIGIASLLEFPTNRGAIYSLFAFAGIVMLFIYTILSVPLFILGSIYTIRNFKNTNEKKYKIIFISSLIINAAIMAVGLYAGYYVIFIAGPSV